MEEHELQRMKKYQSYFQEMAFSKSVIEQEIRSSNSNRTEHLILIYLLSKDVSNHHWQSEVYADIKDIAQMKWKNNNKYLTEKEYFNNLWNMPFENEDNYEIIDKNIEDLIYDKYPIPEDWKNNKEQLITKIKNFYKEVSKLIATGSVSKLEIFKMLDNFRYKND